MRAAVRSCCFLATLGSLLRAESLPNPANAENQQAVLEVTTGRRALANAAWWGFHPEDSTAAIQAAFDSAAKTVLIPYLGEPWVVRPLQLRSRREILLEPGVVILAKKGEYLGSGDSLFTAVGQSNLVIRGYGATLRMRKRDYQQAPYQKAEWRMGIALRGCRNVLIEGLRVEGTGGDGFYVDGGGDLGWSEDITLRNCTAYDNHRQGLSVISAVNLLVENCAFANTWGTAPEAGIDLEPDTENQRLVNCVIRDSVFENNNGNQILIYLKQLSRKSSPVSIRFERCLTRMTPARLTAPEPGPTAGIKGVAGIAVGEIKDDGPQGSIEFVQCMTEMTGKEGARVYDKSSTGARVRFVNCSFSHPWNLDQAEDHGPRVPILLELRRPQSTKGMGGIDFVDCCVYDRVSRPALQFAQKTGDFGLQDVHGMIQVTTPGVAEAKLGPTLHDVDLKIVAAPTQ